MLTHGGGSVWRPRSEIERFGMTKTLLSTMAVIRSSSISTSRARWANPSTPASTRACASSAIKMCAITDMSCAWASSMIGPYNSGPSFSTEPPRSSTQIFKNAALVAAISATWARASSSVAAPKAVGRMVAAPGPASGRAMPRNAVCNRAPPTAPACWSAWISKARSPGSVPRETMTPTPL